MTTSGASSAVLEHLRGVLCDLLLLKPEEVKPDSLLVDDLDVDSLTFIELAFTIEKEFGVDFPDLKASEEIFALLLPDALQRIAAMPGGTTFFEYTKEEAIRWTLRGTGDPLDDEGRERLFRNQTSATLAHAVQGRVPAGLDADASLSTLRLSDLFRFLTVATMAGYIEYLREAQNDRRD